MDDEESNGSEERDPPCVELNGYLYVFGESSIDVYPPEALDGPFKRADGSVSAINKHIGS